MSWSCSSMALAFAILTAPSVGFAAVGSGEDPPYVLSIGFNGAAASKTLKPLSFADDDAVEAVRLFQAGPGRGFLHTQLDADSKERHADQAARAKPATRTSILQSVASMRRRIEADVRRGVAPHVVIWMAGHADKDESGHLFFPLADGGRFDATALFEEIVEPLSLAHRVHLIVDTCFAEGLVNARATISEVPLKEAEAAFLEKSPRRLPNVGILTGATASTLSYEWNEISAGVFSALIRAGLRGAADADGDGAIRYSELLAFAAAAAEGVEAVRARPKIAGFPPRLDADGAVAYRTWLGNTRELSSELSTLGTVHIFDERGRWILGANFEQGHTPALWLPAKGALYLRAGGQEQQLVATDADHLALGTPSPSLPVSRSLLETSLRNGLFAKRFGPGYWGGYRAGAKAQSLPATTTDDPIGPLAVGTSVVAAGATAVAVASLAAGGALYVGALNEQRQAPALQAYAGSVFFFGVFAGAATAAIVTTTVSGLAWAAAP